VIEGDIFTSSRIHNAGHCPAIVVGRGGVFRIESTGLPLGMFLQTESSASRVQLESGDTLVLYMDGLSEARNESDEFGVDRVHDLGAPAGCAATCGADRRLH
jgi:serine phosphatase RsbU (regulator of sigma subunit)